MWILAAAWILLGFSACGPPDPTFPLDTTGLDPAVRSLLEERLAVAREAPGDAAGHGSLGLAYEANGLWPEAAESFANAAELDPGEPLWRYHRAIALRSLGEFDASLELLREVVREQPDSAPFQHRLGDALLESGDARLALGPFQRATELAAHRPEGPVGQAAVLIELEDYEEAATLLVHALALDPSYKRTHYLLGLAYRGLGRPEEAAAQLALGLEGKTRQISDELEGERFRYMVSSSARLERAIHLSEQGKTRRALGILNQLYGVAPEDVAVINNLAATHMRTGNLRVAYELLTKARDLDPTNPTTWINMASCLAGMGTSQRALQHADQAIELAPGLPGAHLERGRILVFAKRSEDAYASLAEAARLDPQLADAQELLAETCLVLERKDDALAHYEVLVRLRPEDLDAWLALGFLALEQGERETAAKAWKAAKRLAPEDPKVRQLQGEFPLSPIE